MQVSRSMKLWAWLTRTLLSRTQHIMEVNCCCTACPPSRMANHELDNLKQQDLWPIYLRGSIARGGFRKCARSYCLRYDALYFFLVSMLWSCHSSRCTLWTLHDSLFHIWSSRKCRKIIMRLPYATNVLQCWPTIYWPYIALIPVGVGFRIFFVVQPSYTAVRSNSRLAESPCPWESNTPTPTSWRNHILAHARLHSIVYAVIISA